MDAASASGSPVICDAVYADIHEFLDENNRHPKPFIWTKSADEILDKLWPLLPANL